MDLYIASGKGKEHKQDECAMAEEDLWRVWDLLMDVFKEDTTSYLEAKTWLITSVSNLPHIPARVRLEALGPYLSIAAAARRASFGGQEYGGQRHVDKRDQEHRGRGAEGRRKRERGNSSSEGDSGRREETDRRGRIRRSSRGNDRSRSSSEHRRGGGKQEGERSREEAGHTRRRSSSGSRGGHRGARKEETRRGRSARRERSRSRSSSSVSRGRRNERDRRDEEDEQRFSASLTPSPSPPSRPQQPTRAQPPTLTQPDSLIVRQLLLLLLEQRGEEVARLLARQPDVFRDFFAGSDLRIIMWFSHFSMSGMTGFKYGAFALAHYALANRDEVWQYLVWEGKHAQAPVSVATKTHYFCEVNVLATVHNFLEHCPSFWSSEQLLKTFTQSGEIIQLDPLYFAMVLHSIFSGSQYSSGGLSTRARNLLEDFICQESWQLLSHRLLSLMGDEELLEVVSALSTTTALKPVRGGGAPSSSQAGTAALHSELQFLAGPQGWQDIRDLTLSGGPHWVTLPQLVLTHALANHRGQLHSMLRAEEDLNAKLKKIESVALRLHGFTSQKGSPLPSYQAPSQEHHQVLALLRPPAQSASSRQLLALEAWTLRLALLHAAYIPATVALQPSSSLPVPDAGTHSEVASLLEATVHRLGGTCRTSHTAPSQQLATVSGREAVVAYSMLPSSGSSTTTNTNGEASDILDEEDSFKKNRKQKGSRQRDRGYELLSSSDEGSKGGVRSRKRRALRLKGVKEKHKKKRKKAKEGKKAKKKGRERKRQYAPSSSEDDRAKGSFSPMSTPDSENKEGVPIGGATEVNREGVLLQGDPRQRVPEYYEVMLPTASESAASEACLDGQQQGSSFRVMGSAQDVADLLACAALKHWLQTALQSI